MFASADTPEPPRFRSILGFDVRKEASCDPSRVHVLCAFALRFSADAFRRREQGLARCVVADGIAVILTYPSQRPAHRMCASSKHESHTLTSQFVSQHNPDLLKAFTGSAILMKVSSPADSLWSSLLLDKLARDDFIATNQRRLGEAYDRATAFLQRLQIPYTPAVAGAAISVRAFCSRSGHFIWVDLRRFLRSRNDKDQLVEPLAAETDLWLELVDAGVLLGAGQIYSAEEDGFFRLTFVRPSDRRRPLILADTARRAIQAWLRAFGARPVRPNRPSSVAWCIRVAYTISRRSAVELSSGRANTSHAPETS